MFQTFTKNEIKMSSILYSQDEHFWNQIQINIQSHWFFLEYSINVNGTEYKTLLELSDDKQVIAISKMREVEITQIHIVSPGYLNKSGIWKMDQLKSIKKEISVDGNSDTPLVIYELMDGRLMADSHYDKKNLNSVTTKTLFEFKK